MGHLGVQDPQAGRQQLCSSFWGPIKTKMLICYICAGTPGPARARSFVGDSASGSLEGCRLVDSLSSCGVPVVFESLDPPPSSSVRVLELHLICRCGSLWRLDGASQKTVILGSYPRGSGLWLPGLPASCVCSLGSAGFFGQGVEMSQVGGA